MCPSVGRWTRRLPLETNAYCTAAPADAGLWSRASDPAADLFGFEKKQFDGLLTGANGTGLDAANLTALFGFEKTSQSSRKPGDRPRCKAYPGTPEWPPAIVWKAFDLILGGALVKTVPLAAPCFNSWPSERNDTRCAFINAHWKEFRFQ